MKTCIQCGETKSLSDFYFSSGRYKSPCKICCLNKRRTLQGMLVERWSGVLNRIEGKHNHSTAIGKERCTREEFFNWALKSVKLLTLYESWVDSGYSRSLTPSVDRIKISKGYTLDNIQWLTMKENNQKGHLDHPEKDYNRKSVTLTKGDRIMKFNSGKEASEYFGINRLAIANNIIKGHKTHGWIAKWDTE